MFDQKKSFPHPKEEVEKKIQKWHEKNVEIEGEIEMKVYRLKQRNKNKVLKEEWPEELKQLKSSKD